MKYMGEESGLYGCYVDGCKRKETIWHEENVPVCLKHYNDDDSVMRQLEREHQGPTFQDMMETVFPELKNCTKERSLL